MAEAVIAPLFSIFSSVSLVVSRDDMERENETSIFLNGRGRLLSETGPRRGPLGGLAVGLRFCRSPWAFVVGCDMPCLDVDVIDYLFRRTSASPNAQIVAARINGYIEPLHAFYRNDCLSAIKKTIMLGRRKIKSFYEFVNVEIVDESELKKFLGFPVSFYNVNTHEDKKLFNAFL